MGDSHYKGAPPPTSQGCLLYFLAVTALLPWGLMSIQPYKPALQSPNVSWKMRQDSVRRKCRWPEALTRAKFNLQLFRATACWTEFFANGFTRHKCFLKMKRLAIFPHIISIVNPEKMSRRLRILGDFFVWRVHRCKGIMLVKLWDHTRNICLRRWTMIFLHSYTSIICKAMPMIKFVELYILTETEFLFPKCWKMT